MAWKFEEPAPVPPTVCVVCGGDLFETGYGANALVIINGAYHARCFTRFREEALKPENKNLSLIGIRQKVAAERGERWQ